MYIKMKKVHSKTGKVTTIKQGNQKAEKKTAILILVNSELEASQIIPMHVEGEVT